MSHTTILIVEDERSIVDLVVSALADTAYEVILAVSGSEGLRIAAEIQRPIHLLLVNVILPDMLGSEIAAKLRKTRPDMRVMLLAGKEDGELSVLQGGWHVLEKPHIQETLLHRIRAELGSAASSGV